MRAYSLRISVIFVAVVAMTLLFSLGGRAGLGDGGVTPPSFTCNPGCDCVIPKSSTVYCISNPFICEVVSNRNECLNYTFANADVAGAYIAITDGGKKPDGCKSAEEQKNCTEESFECYCLGYCKISDAGTCETDPDNQGPAYQVARKVAQSCN